MRKTQTIVLLILAFVIGGTSVFFLTTYIRFGSYGVKQALGLKTDAVFLNDSTFGAPDLDQEHYPKFEGNEDFPTQNSPTLSLENISRKLVSVPSRGRVVVVNLDHGKVFLYNRGDIVDEFVIKSKPIPGSPWETPPGLYEVQYKTEEHFSTVANANMPYTVQFFGNYYIHGWPHDMEGNLVDENFVAGAIRLSSKDAEKVYEFSRIGTDVIVVSSVPSQFQNREITGDYNLLDEGLQIPRLSSRAYMVADIDTGQVLYEYNADRVYAIASVTKLMTALVALESYDQLEETKISRSAVATRGDQGGLKAGQKWLLGDLLYPLLMESSNDAGEALAEHVDRIDFIEAMNGYAKAIGMPHTAFNDASGLSAGNTSTVRDLEQLAEHIYHYKSYILSITQMDKYGINRVNWRNNIPFHGEDSFLGGKHGLTTAAGHTAVTIHDVRLENGEHRNLVFVVLQSENEERDTERLIDYIEEYASFEPFHVAEI